MASREISVAEATTTADGTRTCERTIVIEMVFWADWVMRMLALTVCVTERDSRSGRWGTSLWLGVAVAIGAKLGDGRKRAVGVRHEGMRAMEG
jgi:hypothetical protein